MNTTLLIMAAGIGSRSSPVTALLPFALLMMSLWTTLSRISTTFRELCRKDVQNRGELDRPCLRRRKQSKPHSL